MMTCFMASISVSGASPVTAEPQDLYLASLPLPTLGEFNVVLDIFVLGYSSMLLDPCAPVDRKHASRLCTSHWLPPLFVKFIGSIRYQ